MIVRVGSTFNVCLRACVPATPYNAPHLGLDNNFTPRSLSQIRQFHPSPDFFLFGSALDTYPIRLLNDPRPNTPPKSIAIYIITPLLSSYRAMPYSHHSHSGQFCPEHAKDMLEDVILAAISKQMHVLALTEHMPRGQQDLYPGEVRSRFSERKKNSFSNFPARG